MHKNQPKNTNAVVWQISIAALVVLSFAWISIWDSHFLRVIPLQGKYTLGFASEENLKDLSSICLERKRYECASSTLKALIQKHHSREPIYYQQLVDSYIKLEQPKQALATIEMLEKIQSAHAEALDQKAQMQLKLNEEQKALETLEKAYSLSVGPKHIAIAREQINLMIKMNMMPQAQQKILQVRHSSALANLFMEKELRVIQRQLEVAQIRLPAKQSNTYRR